MMRKDQVWFSKLFLAHPLPMWIYDCETLRFVAVNAAAVSHYRYSEIEFLNMTIRDILPEVERARLDLNLQELANAQFEKAGSWTHCKRDGTLIDVEITSHPISFEGRACRFLLAHDVTERLQAERKIARLSRIYALLSAINSMTTHTPNHADLFQETCHIAVKEGGFALAMICEIAPSAGAVYTRAWSAQCELDPVDFNPTAKPDADFVRWPWSVAALTGKPVIHNKMDGVVAPMPRSLGPCKLGSLAALPINVDDRVVAVLVLFTRSEGVFDRQETRLLEELISDLTHAVKFHDTEQQLSYIAYYDPLTGLPNARLFQDRLTQLLNMAAPEHKSVTVILINVDRFFQFNDALGRHAGDTLLQKIGQRLATVMGSSPHCAARISNDTFALALPEQHHPTDAGTVLEQQLLPALMQPYDLQQQQLRISVRAGLALSPGDGIDTEMLFQHAEVALKNAKQSGNLYLYYAAQMNREHAAKLAMENELRQALEGGQFVMHYQPRVDLLSGRMTSAEALIRWRHPVRGLVGPNEFIGIAEETGIIMQLGDWIIDTVFAQQLSWRARGMDIVPVAINVSALQFVDGRIVHTLRRAFATHDLAPSFIEVELTESVVMNCPDEAAVHLNALKSLGIKLALDDFGTGYSSLSYLKRFPFDFVKIDRSFISDLTNSPEDVAIATAVIAMAHSMKMRVVAEGVETDGQLNYLRGLRCDEMQGFYFSPSVAPGDFELLCRSGACIAPAHAMFGAAVDTLLLVDDEPSHLAALKRLMRRESYRLLTATSGQEGLDVLARNKVHVIIADQRMPGMSGSEFLGIVRELYPDTIRIILSGYTELRAVTDSVNRGAVSKFLTKPWDDAMLLDNVHDAFRRYRPDIRDY